jgi:hypothetical protein
VELQPLLVLPLLAFFVLGALFLIVLRRAGRFLAATRDVERFRRQVGDLGGRIETSLAEVCARIDGLRRGQLDAEALADDLTASVDAVERYTGEAKLLHPPADGVAVRDGIVAELERAGRALEMVEHGRSIQASARSGGREVEAQTSIKRGYLNVLHAREAIAHHVELGRAVGIGDEASGFQRRNA